ncbi:MAG: DNA polymerase IV, partial [Methylocella sp.]
AKLASDHRKPDGLFVITPAMGPAFVEELNVGRFHGIGPVTAAKMNRLGIFTGLDLKAQTQAFLQEHFGKAGPYYYWISRGVDHRPVCANRIRKSIGAETTFSYDLIAPEDMQAKLLQITGKVWRQCETTAVRGRTVTLKVKYADFQIVTRSRTCPDIVADQLTLTQIGLELLAPLFPMQKGVRLLGVSLSSLQSESAAAVPRMTLEPRQWELF